MIRATLTPLSILAALTLACSGDPNIPARDAGPPSVVLGVADVETSSMFIPFSPGDKFYYARQGQAALLLQFALRSWNLGNRLIGEMTIVDPASGTSTVRNWENLILYCLPEGYCEQLPIYFGVHELGGPDELQDKRIDVRAWFEPKGGGPRVSVSTWGVLSGFDAPLTEEPDAGEPQDAKDASAPD